MSDSEKENITLTVEETEAAKKAAEAKRIADEAAATKKAADEASKKAAAEAAKKAADEAAAKKAADEAAATKKAADEAAKKAADEAASKKAADEAAKKAADEAAEAKRIAEEEADLADQLLEVAKLNAITNNLWKEGQKTNFETMSHTETGILKYEIKKRAEVHQGFMTSLTRNSNKIIRQNAPTVQQKPVAKLSTRQTMFNSGMMFGRR